MGNHDNVIDFPGLTRRRHSPRRVLKKAMEPGLTVVIVIGWTEAGQLYFASSEPDGGNVCYLLDRAKHKLMQIVDEMEGG